MMKYKDTILLAICFLLIHGCTQNAKLQYGKQTLILDDFNFDLDLDSFFQDESVFRGYNDELMVSVSEERVRKDSIMEGFIQYSTSVSSKDRILASYAGVDFQGLGLITDWNDEQVLMVCAETQYGSSDKIASIIKKLNENFNNKATLHEKDFFGSTLIIRYQSINKIVQLSIKLPSVDFIDWDNKYSAEKRDIYLSEEIMNKLTLELKELEEIKCYLYISKPEIDATVENLNGTSGFLTEYQYD